MQVSKLLVHPIKSCRGTSVTSAEYDNNGFILDRRWLIVDSRTLKFYTARNLPQMVLIETAIDSDTQELVIRVPQTGSKSEYEELRTPIWPDTEDLELVEGVSIWKSVTDGWAVDSEIAAALSQFLGKPVMLLLKGPAHRETGNDATYDVVGYEDKGTRFQDFYPMLTCTTASLEGSQAAIQSALSSDALSLSSEEKTHWSSAEVAIERWRPNIIISGAPRAFDEDSWEGYSVGPSSQVIYTVARCIRCMLPNVDPSTGVRDSSVRQVLPAFYADAAAECQMRQIPWSVMQDFRVCEPENSSNYCWGMHSVPAQRKGVVSVGDEVHVTRRHANPEGRRQTG